MSRVTEHYPWVADAFEIAKEQDGSRFLFCTCPLKNHRSGPVFRLWIGTSGQLLFGCWAGCTDQGTGAGKLEVLRAVGRSWKDCYPQDQNWKEVKRDIVARYPYFDEQGKVLYETIRLEPGRSGRDKEFRQRQPGEKKGTWVWNLNGVRRVLYRLPELIDPANRSSAVLVVAGEKDCESLRKIGVLGTTNVCGEGAPWEDSYSEVLADRDVIVVEDRDNAGRRHAHEVVGSLLAHGVKSVRRCALPEKDTTAYLTALQLMGVESPSELRQGLWLALRDAPKWRAATTPTRTACTTT